MPPTTRAAVLGEEGFFILQYSGPELKEPIMGDYTGAEYNFHRRRKLLVDKRDAVYMMGPEFEVISGS